MSDKNICRYCGEPFITGRSCKYSPTNLHVAIGDDTKCIFCGSTSYGYGCTYNDGKTLTGIPRALHVHGHGNKRCIYCGSTARGKGCCYSPDNKHHF